MEWGRQDNPMEHVKKLLEIIYKREKLNFVNIFYIGYQWLSH